MEPKVAGSFALALCAVLASPCGSAREVPFQIAVGKNAVPAEQIVNFDVRQVGGQVTSINVDDRLSSRALAEDELHRRQKVKIRWIYQPIEGGPQLEIGTYGSRKGIMKRKLLHVALDWSF